VNYYSIAAKRIAMLGRWISTSKGGETLHDKEVDLYMQRGWMPTGSSRIST